MPSFVKRGVILPIKIYIVGYNFNSQIYLFVLHPVENFSLAQRRHQLKVKCHIFRCLLSARGRGSECSLSFQRLPRPQF